MSEAARMAAQWWTDRLQQGDKQRFRVVLEHLVQSELDLHGRCRLDCDYDPQDLLLIAVQEAGIECQGYLFSAKGILPMKTLLWVHPDRLEPKEGYGNWTEIIKIEETNEY